MGWTGGAAWRAPAHPNFLEWLKAHDKLPRNEAPVVLMEQVLYWHFLRETGLPMSHVVQCPTFSPSSAALRNVNRLAHPDGGRVDAGCVQDFEETAPTRQLVQLTATACKRARKVQPRQRLWASPGGGRTHYANERTLAVPTLRGSGLLCSGWLVVVDLPSRPAGQAARIMSRTAGGAGEQNDQRSQRSKSAVLAHASS